MQSNTPSNWPDTPFDEVRAYFYNERGDPGVPIIAEGRLHPTVTNPEGALLSSSQVERFAQAFFSPHAPSPVAACYYPRHAFVYRDAAQQVVAIVGICFECLNYRTVPRISALRPDWVALAELVEELGLPLGRDRTAADMRAMHEKFSRMT